MDSRSKREDGTSGDETLIQLKKEVVELEQLVKGYQQENERLYQVWHCVENSGGCGDCIAQVNI